MFKDPETTRTTLSVVALIAICGTVILAFLYASIAEQYRVFLTVALVTAGALTLVVILRGMLNEQQLRRTRILFQTEIPFDGHGELHYLPADAQVNENHVPYFPHPITK